MNVGCNWTAVPKGEFMRISLLPFVVAEKKTIVNNHLVQVYGDNDFFKMLSCISEDRETVVRRGSWYYRTSLCLSYFNPSTYGSPPVISHMIFINFFSPTCECAARQPGFMMT